MTVYPTKCIHTCSSSPTITLHYYYHHQTQTLVDDWFSIPEECNGRERFDSILLGQPCFLGGDKVHPMVVCVIINVL